MYAELQEVLKQRSYFPVEFLCIGWNASHATGWWLVCCFQGGNEVDRPVQGGICKNGVKQEIGLAGVGWLGR
jgi:hypothetical protein